MHAEVTDNGEEVQAETLNQEELDFEIRRGSDASQYNGCCLDSAILQQFVSMGSRAGKAAICNPLRSSTRYLV